MKEAKRVLNKRDTELLRSGRYSRQSRNTSLQRTDSEFNSSIFKDTEALDDEQEEMNDEPIDEVEALKDVFYQFFSDKRS